MQKRYFTCLLPPCHPPEEGHTGSEILRYRWCDGS
ncbi:hypothetical protein N172_11195 [Pantoea dispersa EGD-AAK13]|nr:hypothetical protein N172_11195 [Pantoea dispersa EGD-AAK13]